MGYKNLLKPKGRVFLRATGLNRYAGGDTKWHLVTGYDIDSFHNKDVCLKFTWRGEKNARCVEVSKDGTNTENLEFRNEGKPITAKQAVKIIMGTE